MRVAEHLEHAEQIAHLDIESGLLAHLASQRIGEVLVVLDAAPGDRPQSLPRLGYRA